MRRKNKIVLNTLLIIITFFLLMMSLGFYPGTNALKARLKINNDVKDVIMMDKEKHNVLMYSDSYIFQYQTQRLFGFTKLLNKTILPPEANHFYDHLGNEWFEFDEAYEIMGIKYYDGINYTIERLDSEKITSGNHSFSKVLRNPLSKYLIDSNGQKFWVHETGFYSITESLEVPLNFSVGNQFGEIIEIDINNLVLSKFFLEKHTRNIFMSNDTQFTPNNTLEQSGFKEIGSFTRETESTENILETYFYNEDFIVVKNDILDENGNITDSPAFLSYLNPVVEELFISELLPFLLD